MWKIYLIAGGMALFIALAADIAGLPPVFSFGLVTIVIGTFISLPVGALVIRLSTQQFAAQIDQASGLENGGKYIGLLERGLIMMLVLMGETAGVGFLIAAKSILRFNEIKGDDPRKKSEYSIIGPLMSFGWGLLIANLTKLVLGISLTFS